MCAQRRLRSAWASAQSDQSLRCPHEESLGPWLPTERTAKTDQTGHPLSLIRVFAVRMKKALIWADRLIRWFCRKAPHFFLFFFFFTLPLGAREWLRSVTLLEIFSLLSSGHFAFTCDLHDTLNQKNNSTFDFSLKAIRNRIF